MTTWAEIETLANLKIVINQNCVYRLIIILDGDPLRETHTPNTRAHARTHAHACKHARTQILSSMSLSLSFYSVGKFDDILINAIETQKGCLKLQTFP